MTKNLALLVCLIITHSIVVAQFSSGAADSAKAEIMQLTADWNKAIVNRDSLVLDKILAPDYSLNGSVVRSAWMNNTIHHIVTDTLQVISQLNISFYGQAAKSEGMFFWKASFDGVPRIHAEYAITDIWIKQNNHWQVLLRMSQQTKTR